MQVRSLGWEDALEKEMATHSSILSWRTHGQRSLEGYSPQGRKELDTTEVTQHLATRGKWGQDRNKAAKMMYVDERFIYYAKNFV